MAFWRRLLRELSGFGCISAAAADCDLISYRYSSFGDCLELLDISDDTLHFISPDFM